MSDDLTLADLHLCFEGAVPAVIGTVAADGTPNVTYLSKVRLVDRERVALSNQFFSKTARNLAENPRACAMVIDPASYDEFRLDLVYERTERRGPLFDQLRDDVEVVAALSGMQQVFRLRTADIYRVRRIERVPPPAERRGRAPVGPPTTDITGQGRDPMPVLAELTTRIGRCPDLDTLVTITIQGLAAVAGYEHCLLLLADEQGRSLYTIASHGYAAEGVGSEVPLGEGIVGLAATRCVPIRVGGVRQLSKYSRRVRDSYEDEGEIGPGREIPVPGLAEANSLLAVPAMAFGGLVGVLVVESTRMVAFTEADEALLSAVASLVATAIEADRAREALAGADGRTDAAPSAGPSARTSDVAPEPVAAGTPTLVRFFAVDGSTFLDGDYLIKGVAGRILWSLLGQHQRDGRVEFTNKEVRLDPTLELPEYRDNLESRLILLKRRLDEREAPVRIVKTGRGRFRLDVHAALELEAVAPAD